MSDKFPPLMIAPLKKPSLLAMIWQAISGWVLFGLGCVAGWIARGMG